MRYLIIYLVLCCALMAQATKVGGSGSTKAGGSGTTKVSAVVSASATATDNFTRANSDPISNPMSDGISTWQTTTVGACSGTIKIASNELQASTGTNDTIARVSTPTFSGQHRATWTVPSGGVSGSTYSGPAVRIQGTSNCSCYCAFTNGSTTDVVVYKVTDSGSYSKTQLGSNFTITALSPGDTLRLEVTGTSTVTLTLYRNGVSQGTRTDSSSTFTGGQPGLFVYNTIPNSAGFTASDF